jgi:branched-chain amino acid transport system substrate-binding protein
VLNAMGDPVVGVITSHHYSAAHESPENTAFVKAFKEVSGFARPNFMGVGGYDGMAAIAEVMKKLPGGRIDGDKAMEILKGLKLQSPRGPISIDPATRDIVQTVYIRKVEKRGAEYWNVEFDKVPDVKDPAK